jgi:hypothetical protein
VATTKALELAQLVDGIEVNANGEITNIGTVSSLDVSGDISTSTLSTTGNVAIGGSATVTGTVTADGFATTGNITFGDNDRAIFGANNDLLIYHNGSHSYIKDEGTGHLVLLGDDLRLGNSEWSKNYLKGVNGAETTIYYDGDPKLSTTNTGISVTGDISTTGNVTLTRNGSSSLTRTVAIGGAQQSDGTDYARLDFVNYDANDASPEDYVGARIAAQNASGAEYGELSFYTSVAGTLGERLTISAGGLVTAKNGLSVVGSLTTSGDFTLSNSVGRIKAATDLELIIDYDNNNIGVLRVKNGAGDVITTIDESGNLTVAGNFTVSGTTTTVNTDNLLIEDLNITLANGAANNTVANGAGITIDGANATLTYDSTTDGWSFDRSLNVGATLSTAYVGTDFNESAAALKISNADTTSGTGAFILLSHVANSTGKAAIGVVQGPTSRDGELVFLTRNGNATGDPIVEAVRIDRDGKVGIGTNDPVGKLDLVNGTSAVELQFKETSTAYHRLGIRKLGSKLHFGEFSNDGTSLTNILTIDGSGDTVTIGPGTSRTDVYQAQGQLQIESTGATVAHMIRNSNDSTPPYFVFGKTRGTSNGDFDLVSNGDILGQLRWAAGDDTDLASTAAAIWVGIDGDGVSSPATNNTPGYMGFATTNRGNSTATGKMWLMNDGELGIGTNSPRSLLDVRGDITQYRTDQEPRLILNYDVTPVNGAAHGSITISHSTQNSYSGKVHIAPRYFNGSAYTWRDDCLVADAYGRVGVNTSSPAVPFHVVGLSTSSAEAEVRIQHQTYPALDFYSMDQTSANRNWRLAGVYNSYGKFEILNSSSSNGNPNTTRFAIDKDGNVNIGHPTGISLANYSFDVAEVATKFSVVASNTGSGWFETAHFAAGGDSDYTGAIVRIGHYDNDRGLAIKAGRQASNRSIAHFELRSSNNVDYPTLTLKEEVANGAQLYVGINNDDPSTNLHIIDEADGGASWNSVIQVGRRAGSGDNFFLRTLHDGSDGIDAIAFNIGGTDLVQIHETVSSTTMTVTNSGGNAGDGKALLVKASGRGVGIPDANILQVENNNDVLFGIENAGAIKSMNYLPTQRPAFLADFSNSKSLNSKMTFERRSRATYTDENGLVRIADFDEPRFDHNPETGECIGLLIEPPRTNFVPNVSSGEWEGSSSASVYEFTDETLSPAGDYTAAKFIRGTSAQYQTVSYPVTFPASGNVWVTFYGKKGTAGGDKFFLQWYDSVGPWQNATWDINNLEGGNYNNGPTVPNANGTTEYTQFARYVGNGWYHMGARLQTGGGGVTFTFHPHSNGQSAGDGSTTFSYMWGVQVEMGDVPTSYVPTWDAPASRAQDIAYVDNKVHKLYKEDNATLYAESFSYEHTNSSGYPIVRFDDRTIPPPNGTAGSQAVNLDVYSNGVAARIIKDNSFGTNLQIGAGIKESDYYRIALSYLKTSVYYTYNGYQSSDTSDGSTALPEAENIESMWFGNSQYPTYIRKVAYWNTYYDLTTLTALTEE